MAEFALRELIDEKRLQHLQNEFCKVTGVTAVCVDKEGRAITEPYIDKSLIRPDGEDPILGEYRKKAAQALDRVQEGSLEEQVVEELLLMKKEFHTAMLLITHNIGVVRKMADRILVLQNGKVMDYGDTQKVLENPESQYTRQLMDSVIRLKRREDQKL